MKDKFFSSPKLESGDNGKREDRESVDGVLESSKTACEDLEAMRRKEGLLARKSFALDVFLKTVGNVC